MSKKLAMTLPNTSEPKRKWLLILKPALKKPTGMQHSLLKHLVILLAPKVRLPCFRGEPPTPSTRHGNPAIPDFQ